MKEGRKEGESANEGIVCTANEGIVEGIVCTANEGIVECTANEGIVRTANEGIVRTANEGIVRTAEEGIVSTANEGIVSTAEEGITSTAAARLIGDCRLRDGKLRTCIPQTDCHDAQADVVRHMQARLARAVRMRILEAQDFLGAVIIAIAKATTDP